MVQKPKILLIEDEDPIRQVYKSELELSNFQVDDFAFAKQGLDAFKNNQYDIVVLDIILSDANGLKVLEEMRQDDEKKDTPILILTALNQDVIIRKATQLGATAYLQKDLITPDLLADKIKEILAPLSS